MGCNATKEKEEFDKRIITESCGLINQSQLDNFYMSYNFTPNEILTIIDEYKKICPNPNGLITPDDLMNFPPFQYSPFGYHILEALDINNKDEDNADKKKDKKKEKDKEKTDNKSKSKLKLKEKSKKNSKKKKKKAKDEEEEEEEEEEINEEEITNEDQISDIPKVDAKDNKKGNKKESKNDDKKQNKNDDKNGKIGFQDFVYFVYLFSSHVKILEKAQLYFRLFDFDNDGKITPSDIIVYLENLDRESKEVLQETKKYLTKKRKINKDHYIEELSEFKNANENKQIANLIIKEASAKGKNYIDFYDFRNMFLSMQFIPEYSCPLYLEERFNDGRVGAGALKPPKKDKSDDGSDNDKKINQNETQAVVVPVNDLEKKKDKKDIPKEEKRTANESKASNKKDEKKEEGEDEDEEEEEEDDEEEEKGK